MEYPVTLTPEEDGSSYTVTFPNIPEAITCGDTVEEALLYAFEALESALDFYFEDKRMIPMPSNITDGGHFVELPPSLAAKVLLFNEMLSQNVRPATLAHRMNILPQEVNRILNPHHKTRIDTIAEAIAALGKHLEIKIA